MIGLTHAKAENRFECAEQLRRILQEAGRLGAGAAMLGAPASPETAFEQATPVEGDVVRAVAVPTGDETPADVGFCDGIQRFAVEGWVDVTPVIRAHVAAAVLHRHERVLKPVAHRESEFIVAPLDTLHPDVADRIREIGVPLYDSGDVQRRHPILDVRRAAQIIRTRRQELERQVARDFRDEFPAAWVVVDGGLRGYELFPGKDQLIGVIRSHETQYLAGADLTVALTLDAAHRTTVFERRIGDAAVHSWYLRLWEWERHDLLYGLLRLERAPTGDATVEADRISGWILSERIPLAGRSRRWDRYLYPIHEVESYLNARFGAWA